MEIKTIREYLTSLQDWIVGRLEEMDGNAFRRDSWDRPDGGGGVSCLIEEGSLFERGGVNFSHVTGSSLPPSATV
ncbi:MAG: coproporphyrinogen III oxidase, partial [Burkholderiales bacterium]